MEVEVEAKCNIHPFRHSSTSGRAWFADALHVLTREDHISLPPITAQVLGAYFPSFYRGTSHHVRYSIITLSLAYFRRPDRHSASQTKTRSVTVQSVAYNYHASNPLATSKLSLRTSTHVDASVVVMSLLSNPWIFSVLCISVIAGYLAVRRRPFGKPLPGPKGLPLLGNVLQLGTHQWIQMTKWSKEYGEYKYLLPERAVAHKHAQARSML